MKKLRAVLFVLFFVSQLGFARGKKDSWENLNRLRPGQKIEVVDLQSNINADLLLEVCNPAGKWNTGTAAPGCHPTP